MILTKIIDIDLNTSFIKNVAQFLRSQERLNTFKQQNAPQPIIRQEYLISHRLSQKIFIAHQLKKIYNVPVNIFYN
jgi:hypothetical protein